MRNIEKLYYLYCYFEKLYVYIYIYITPKPGLKRSNARGRQVECDIVSLRIAKIRGEVKFSNFKATENAFHRGKMPLGDGVYCIDRQIKLFVFTVINFLFILHAI